MSKRAIMSLTSSVVSDASASNGSVGDLNQCNNAQIPVVNGANGVGGNGPKRAKIEWTANDQATLGGVSAGGFAMQNNIGNGSPDGSTRRSGGRSNRPENGNSNATPSRVIHIRNIPPDATEAEIIQLGIAFGRVSNILVLKGKNQAFLEMEDESAASTMVSYLANCPQTLRDRPIYVQFSNHKQLKTDNSSSNANTLTQAALQAANSLVAGSSGESAVNLGHAQQGNLSFRGNAVDNNFSTPNRNSGGSVMSSNDSPATPTVRGGGGQNTVLRVMVEHMIYPVTLDVICQIFSRIGKVQKIVTFTKNNTYQALVQMADVVQAQAARVSLDGRNIYNGCCTLKIDFSKLSGLNVKYNNDKSRDYTNPSLGSGPLFPESASVSGDDSRMAVGNSPGGLVGQMHPMHSQGHGNNLMNSMQHQQNGLIPSSPSAGTSITTPSGHRHNLMSQQHHTLMNGTNAQGGGGGVTPSSHQLNAINAAISGAVAASGLNNAQAAAAAAAMAAAASSHQAAGGTGGPATNSPLMAASVGSHPHHIVNNSPHHQGGGTAGNGGVAVAGLAALQTAMAAAAGLAQAQGHGANATGAVGHGSATGHGATAGLGGQAGNGLLSCVLLATSLNEKYVGCDQLFTLFGVYGNVVRVKIMRNKRHTALVQMGDIQQALLAMGNLDRIRLFGSFMNVIMSKHQQVQLPRLEGQVDSLNKDYSMSSLNRFKKAGSKNHANIYPPSMTLHLSNIPECISEQELCDLFTQCDKRAGQLQTASPGMAQHNSSSAGGGDDFSGGSESVAKSPQSSSTLAMGNSGEANGSSGSNGSVMPTTPGGSKYGNSYVPRELNVVGFKFFNMSNAQQQSSASGEQRSDKRMALIKLGSLEEAVVALVRMHNYPLTENSHLRVSFTKSTM